MHLHRRIIILSVFFLLIFFYGFSREVKRGRFKDLDFAVTVKIQDRMPKRFDEFWEDIGFFASPVVTSVFVMALTVWSFIKAKGLKKKMATLLIPFAFGLLTLAELYGKSVVHHPAPPFFLLKNPTTIFPKYYVNEQYSYPSGHAGRAVFVAILLFATMKQPARSAGGFNNIIMRKKLWIKFALVIFVGLVLIGKVYLGQHWFSDVVGGIIIGTALSMGFL